MFPIIKYLNVKRSFRWFSLYGHYRDDDGSYVSEGINIFFGLKTLRYQSLPNDFEFFSFEGVDQHYVEKNNFCLTWKLSPDKTLSLDTNDLELELLNAEILDREFI